MIQSVEGIYRGGKIELLEPTATEHHARVIVTFLPNSGRVDLPSRGIGEAQAADLRGRLASFAADWERPDMDVYDTL